MRAVVRGVSVWGPGLEGWEMARGVLSGVRDHAPRDAPLPAPAILPATERRRASLAVRLALTVAEAACVDADLPADALRLVFASANGDGAVVHAILESLSAADGMVSPTQFHNSVHNVAAGYWAIATRSRQPVTCLGCHDATFGMALFKAVAEVEVERAPVLLCAYDTPLPEPLHALRPTEGSFGVALVLAPSETPDGVARLDLAYAPDSVPPEAGEPELPSLSRLSRVNPAARSLRLLQSLARGGADAFPVALPDGRLEVRVAPCSTATASPP